MKTIRAWLNAQPNHRYTALLFFASLALLFYRLLVT
jgi:hypothetical protein